MRKRAMPGQPTGLRAAFKLSDALRDTHSRGHKNWRRRRLRSVLIERHHRTEQPAA